MFRLVFVYSKKPFQPYMLHNEQVFYMFGGGGSCTVRSHGGWPPLQGLGPVVNSHAGVSLYGEVQFTMDNG